MCEPSNLKDRFWCLYSRRVPLYIGFVIEFACYRTSWDHPVAALSNSFSEYCLIYEHEKDENKMLKSWVSHSSVLICTARLDVAEENLAKIFLILKQIENFDKSLYKVR